MEIQTAITAILLSTVIISGIALAINLMPSDVGEFQEILQNQILHPCQIAVLEEFDIYNDNAQYLSDPNSTTEEFEEYLKELLIRDESNKKLFEENNCNTTQSEWHTSEFQKEIEVLFDEGF